MFDSIYPHLIMLICMYRNKVDAKDRSLLVVKRI